MPRQLDHILKLTRANEHLDVLRNEWEWWIASHPYRIVREHDLESGDTILSAEPFGKPPAKLAPIIGDFVHNLRSCLDHVALRLAENASGGRLTPDDERASQFPICDNEPLFRESTKRRLAHVSGGPLSIIEGVQPYPGRDQNEPLRTIRDLSDFDKHRRLAVVAQNARLVAADVLSSEWTAESFDLTLPQGGNSFEGKTQIFRSKGLVGPSGSEVDVDLRLAVDVAFAQTAPAAVAGEDVLVVLEALWTFVAVAVISPLKPYLDPGKLPE